MSREEMFPGLKTVRFERDVQRSIFSSFELRSRNVGTLCRMHKFNCIHVKISRLMRFDQLQCQRNEYDISAFEKQGKVLSR